MNLYYHRLNLPESQIGILAALAPWIAAPAGELSWGREYLSHELLHSTSHTLSMAVLFLSAVTGKVCYADGIMPCDHGSCRCLALLPNLCPNMQHALSAMLSAACLSCLHAGSLWAACADRTGWHKPLLLAASLLQLLGRSSAALVHTFPGLVALVVVTEGFGSPVTILSDIAIMSAAEDVRLQMLFAA